MIWRVKERRFLLKSSTIDKITENSNETKTQVTGILVGSNDHYQNFISFSLVIRLGDGFMVDYESNDEDQHDKDEVTVAQDQINLFHFDGSSTFVSFN